MPLHLDSKKGIQFRNEPFITAQDAPTNKRALVQEKEQVVGQAKDSFIGVQSLFKQQFGDLASDQKAFHGLLQKSFGEGYDKALAEEYRRSLINNLEVLRSLSDLEDARREFVHSQYDTQRSYWNLKVSAGDLP